MLWLYNWLVCRKKVVFKAKNRIGLGFIFIIYSYLFGQWYKHETSDSRSPRPRNNLRWLCRRMRNSCLVDCQSPNTVIYKRITITLIDGRQIHECTVFESKHEIKLLSFFCFTILDFVTILCKNLIYVIYLFNDFNAHGGARD